MQSIMVLIYKSNKTALIRNKYRLYTKFYPLFAFQVNSYVDNKTNGDNQCRF